MSKPSRRSAAPAAPTPKSLNPKQERFVVEYLVDLNASQAAIRAGYSVKAAKEQGHRLLTNAHIQKAVQEHRQRHQANAGLSIERVLKEAQRLAFFDIRKLVDKDGNPIPINQLDDDTAAAIQGLELASERSRDEEGTETTVRKYKVADKNSALERLFKHLGLFERDNKQSSGVEAMAAFVAELSARGSRLPTKGGQ
jgi:phage terminase small subunit